MKRRRRPRQRHLRRRVRPPWKPPPPAAPTEPVVAAAAIPSTNTPPVPFALPSPEDAEPALIQVQWRPGFNPEIVLGLVPGFLISEDGYAVTSGIMVTGSETLAVLLPGSAEPVSARYVAGNECLNLAVIQVSGTGHPYLELKARPVAEEDSVSVPTYVDTLQSYDFNPSMIVAVDLDGATAEVDTERLASHWASSYPYSGPILDEQGNVVGIRAGSIATSVSRYDAVMIPIGDLLEAIELLRQGENTAWIGLASAAASVEQTGYPGIYIVEVHPGSPAAELGLHPRDQILEMDGVTLGDDGTKSAYCEILRELDPTTPIPVTVLRPGEDQILEGELFGDPLAVVGTVTEYVAASPR